MDYSIEKITTAADCDILLQMAATKKRLLGYKRDGENIQYDSISEGAATVEADLASTIAEISSLETALAGMAPGQTRALMEDKLVKAKHKKYLLEQRRERYGVLALLNQQFDVNCMEKQSAEVDSYIAALNQRKEEIG